MQTEKKGQTNPDQTIDKRSGVSIPSPKSVTQGSSNYVLRGWTLMQLGSVLHNVLFIIALLSPNKTHTYSETIYMHCKYG